MYKTGEVINKINGSEIFTVLLYSEEDYKTAAFTVKDEAPCIRRKVSPSICAGCCGCGSSGKNEGLFNLSGNKITALNKSGKKLHKGCKVSVRIAEQKVFRQFLIGVMLPVIAASIFYFIFSKVFHSELLSIGGAFTGLAVSLVLAFFIQKLTGAKSLPEIINADS